MISFSKSNVLPVTKLTVSKDWTTQRALTPSRENNPLASLFLYSLLKKGGLLSYVKSKTVHKKQNRTTWGCGYVTHVTHSKPNFSPSDSFMKFPAKAYSLNDKHWSNN